MEYILKINQNEFSKININTKSLLILINDTIINEIKKGDIIFFENYEKHSFIVRKVTKYNSFNKVFENEKVKFIYSNGIISNIQKKIKNMYSEKQENSYLLIIEITREIQKKEVIEIRSLSNLITINNKSVNKIISNVYEVEDFICQKILCERSVTQILDDNREIFVGIVNKNIVGYVFLKKEYKEKKICKLGILNKYCDERIITKLIEKSLDFLETEKPIIVLNNNNLRMFNGIIEKYEWQQTKSRPCDNKDNSTIEMIFNEKIN